MVYSRWVLRYSLLLLLRNMKGYIIAENKSAAAIETTHKYFVFHLHSILKSGIEWSLSLNIRLRLRPHLDTDHIRKEIKDWWGSAVMETVLSLVNGNRSVRLKYLSDRDYGRYIRLHGQVIVSRNLISQDSISEWQCTYSSEILKRKFIMAPICH